ncbi:MAG TPA: type II toxin-antitoxin system VapC family toxin [Candidatus Nanoarchaeia archaeon]|nr:type II toxin-antitoxin system VapC family toxin [Candidatus Nanoarchaeia archaeon]
MVGKYYIDTSIWMDLLEDRKGYNDEPLGDYALKLFAMIKAKKHQLVVSDLLIRELESNYSVEEINGMILPFQKIMRKIFVTKEQRNEARKIAEERNLPPGDVLHAIVARDYNFTMITRDKHFQKLKDITKHCKPEEIISIS